MAFFTSTINITALLFWKSSICQTGSTLQGHTKKQTNFGVLDASAMGICESVPDCFCGTSDKNNDEFLDVNRSTSDLDNSGRNSNSSRMYGVYSEGRRYYGEEGYSYGQGRRNYYGDSNSRYYGRDRYGYRPMSNGNGYYGSGGPYIITGKDFYHLWVFQHFILRAGTCTHIYAYFF